MGGAAAPSPECARAWACARADRPLPSRKSPRTGLSWSTGLLWATGKNATSECRPRCATGASWTRCAGRACMCMRVKVAPCTQMPVGGCLAEWRGRRAQVEWAGVHHQPQTGMIATFAKLSIGLGWAINPCRSLGAVLPFLSRSLCSPAPCLRIWPAESEVLRDLVVQAKLLGEGCAEACDSHSHKGRACRAKHPHPSGLCNAPGVGVLDTIACCKLHIA